MVDFNNSGEGQSIRHCLSCTSRSVLRILCLPQGRLVPERHMQRETLDRGKTTPKLEWLVVKLPQHQSPLLINNEISCNFTCRQTADSPIDSELVKVKCPSETNSSHIIAPF